MKPHVECFEISVVPTVLDDSTVSSEKHRRKKAPADLIPEESKFYL